MFAEPGERALEDGRRLFAMDCEFVAGAAQFDALPPVKRPEVAFAGRSNVGKSSLLNALTGRNRLARVSQTPGRTRQINVFDLAGRLMLTDLPGYGFARAAKRDAAAWNALVFEYLRRRANLRRVMLLIDSRRGVRDNDLETMKLMDTAAVSYQLVLTKTDAVGEDALRAVAEATSAEAKRHGAAHPELLATSSEAGSGISELRAELAALAEPAPPVTLR